ncbi:MAG TPA: hypothetical protein ENK19_08060 [Acidobacteria bacterium]|nr:hypothetical protein [Acidobacteriota bacterium]
MRRAIFARFSRRAVLALTMPLIAGMGVLAVPAAHADDLGGADHLLCASLTATRCTPDGCTTDRPTAWNIPQFIEIDLAHKVLKTTVASGQNRSTPIRTLIRENGQIVIQGFENGRAFSFVIDEASGDLNAAIATPAGSNVVFAACTPMPAGR